jgi:regulator of sigma E protease
LQLVRRLGESGSLQLLVREQGSTADSPRELALDNWLKGLMSRIRFDRWVFAHGVRAAAGAGRTRSEGPAQAAGLKTGDRLLALDGQALDDWQQVVDTVRTRPDTKIMLRVERDGAQIDVPVTLAARGEGKAPVVIWVPGKGVDWPPEMIREVSYGPLAAIGEGARRTWTMSVLTLDSLKKMLFGELSVKNLSGPITIAKVAGASAQSGVADFLNFLAYLSISLGVLNLLPIPVLDGGICCFI